MIIVFDGEKNLVGSKELAQIFGLSDRRIQQLTAQGTIKAELVTENGHRVRKYDLLPTIHTYVVSLQDQIKRGHRTDKEIELKEQKLEADIALKESQGELHRLKTDIAAGNYISIEEVRLDYAKFFVIFKKFAMSIPSRIGGILASFLEPLVLRKVEKEMSGEITELLKSFVVAGKARPKDVKGILSDESKKMA